MHPTTTGAKPPLAEIPFADALAELARGRPNALAGLLHEVEVHATVAGTRVSSHCHALRPDAHGRPRVRELVREISTAVLDYAIPRTQILEAQEEYETYRTTTALVRLASEAKELFTDIENSGEGGELLLFLLAETFLGLPQLLCKMDMKTSSRMHYHGADGLHAGVDQETGRLVLYWGESKIYEDPAAAVRDCLKSLAPYLADEGGSGAAGERDLQLLRRHADLSDPELESALKRFLDPRSPEFTDVEFRGLCLVGFDCDAYPGVDTACDLNSVVEGITAALPTWKDHIKRRYDAEKLTGFGMHFFCVPFPSVAEFRKQFRREIGIDGDS
jgi:hypothetical protein